MRSWIFALFLPALSAGCHSPSVDATSTPRTAERAASPKEDVARWAETAARAQRAAGSGDGAADASLAESLFRLGLHRGALVTVTRVSGNARHPARRSVLPWIAKLALVLADARDLVGVASAYDSEPLSQWDNDDGRPIFDALSYLRLRRLFETRAYDAAIALASRVSPTSPFYAKSLFFGSMSQVQMRRSVPSAEALNRIRSLPPAALGEEDAPLVDLATIDLARLYYSAAIRLDAGKSPVLDAAKIQASLSYWHLVKGANLARRARFEEGWALFMVGDQTAVEERTLPFAVAP